MAMRWPGDHQDRSLSVGRRGNGRVEAWRWMEMSGLCMCACVRVLLLLFFPVTSTTGQQYPALTRCENGPPLRPIIGAVSAQRSWREGPGAGKGMSPF